MVQVTFICLKNCFLKTFLFYYSFLLLQIEYLNIGRANTKIGAINTTNVTVFATPKIEIVARQNPKNCAPTSPINVFAGFILNGKIH